jgi:hypothetical protein
LLGFAPGGTDVAGTVVRALFRGGPDDPEAGVREPRRPLQPSLSGAIALDEPDDRDAVP